VERNLFIKISSRLFDLKFTELLLPMAKKQTVSETAQTKIQRPPYESNRFQ